MKCRLCASALHDVFLDLGTAPASNAFLAREALERPETYFPLKLFHCPRCQLVQVDEVQGHAELFNPEYAYFSSFSPSWLAHSERFVAAAALELGLHGRSLVVEIASNDGYLLQYVKARGIPCLGVEPTASTARVARERGIETIDRFFGLALAQQLVADRGQADLVVGNNVLAHVPALHDFVAGLAVLVAAEGTLSLEFPHLLELVRNRQFDTVYHEHFSYFSFHTVCTLLGEHGLRCWRVETLPTHGGSLRVWACPVASARREDPSVAALLARERREGMLTADFYRGFQAVAEGVKDAFLAFLLAQKAAGRRVMGYGAAAKGNTLLNFAGIRADLIAAVADASRHKQGRFLPGSRIPVVDEATLRAARPDVVVILPWNLRQEVVSQLAYLREWGGKFVLAVPELVVL